MKLMEASNAFVSMNQRVKETHSILNAGDQFAVEDSRAEFLSGGNGDGIIWAMPIAHLVKVPLKYADEVDALVAKFLEEKTQLLAEKWKHTPTKLEILDEIEEEPKEEVKEESKEEEAPEKPKKKSTAKKSTTKKSTGTKKKKASENVVEVKE